jgi:hypothetical protein
MGLNIKTAKDIQDFVHTQPRTIQEIARLLGKNWRTAESYVEEVIGQYGTLGIKTFRPGTKAALKIVYWNQFEKFSTTSSQESLFNEIKNGRTRTDFDPYDIYHLSDPSKRSCNIEMLESKEDPWLIKSLSFAKKSVLIFSGNMSLIEMHHNNKTVLEVLSELAKKGVNVKILARADVSSVKSLAKIAAINKHAAVEAINIHHRHQPLRAVIVDGQYARLKDEKEKHKYKSGELPHDLNIFYTIEDPNLVAWLEKTFWHFFSQSIPAHERLPELEKISAKIHIK